MFGEINMSNFASSIFHTGSDSHTDKLHALTVNF